MTLEEMTAARDEVVAVLKEGAQRNGRITEVEAQPFEPGDEPEIMCLIDGEPFVLVLGVV